VNFFGRLFLPLAAVIGAGGLWLAVEYDRDTVFALGPAADGDTPGALAPGAGPLPGHPAAATRAEPPARERFARAFDRSDQRPRIAVIVTGLGLARDATVRAIEETPPEATLAFSLYADNAGPLVERARRRGHEILLAVPMEPADLKRRDAGPAALSVSLAEPAARQRLGWMFGRVASHVGIIGDLGDRFSRDPIAMKPVFEELAARGMLYVDNPLESGDATPAGGTVSVATGRVPVAGVTLWLDRDAASGASADALERSFAAAEAAARRGTPAIVLASAAQAARVAAWMKTFDRKGIAAAPITAVVRGGS